MSSRGRYSRFHATNKRKWAPTRKFMRKALNHPYSIPRNPQMGSMMRGPRQFQWATLGYNEQFTAAPGTGSSDGYSFRLNGMFDPRVNAGGHQPQYFDQLMAIYTYFVVTSCDIVIRAVPENNPATGGTNTYQDLFQGLACIAPYGATTNSASSAASDILEFPGCQTDGIVAGGKAGQVKLHVDMPKLFGISWKGYVENPAFWGTAAADPTTQMGAFVGVIAAGAGAVPPVSCQVTVTYKAKFMGLKVVATS